MCLATLSFYQSKKEPLSYQNITQITNQDGVLSFVDLMGRRNEIRGVIREMDFLNNKVIIDRN
jgi:predicted RNA-binding protein